ncbi:DddA-like double-stranded DNA deaminase toxin [Labedaea rhizosphaerae]|uniref:Nucleic acid/nucleotide deaminase of polymorphic system toxin n=1 Tax=Labedaea rhizosphaerae TaxID=598644 RepID=A0A4R6SHI9_LABRH|nr:DddA-like double-stranded DNA deaminase toxin [Labedaea rhizosphaerae]TDQ01093.1 nucleic acid/nucleotide deaminase of polymorphic system toxin [Labedaea rhizosphaerae]
MAQNGSGCVGKLVGWAVAAILVVIVAKSCGLDLNPFGGDDTACEASGSSSSGAVAYADDDSCPDYLREAVGDSAWAHDQQEAIRDLKLTVGRYMTSASAAPQTMTSGYDHFSDLADAYLRDSDFNYPERGQPTVISHVETKIAAKMRHDGVTAAVVAINNPQVCGPAMGCQQAVPAILPEGSVLYVWELDADEPVTLEGRATP